MIRDSVFVNGNLVQPTVTPFADSLQTAVWTERPVDPPSMDSEYVYLDRYMVQAMLDMERECNRRFPAEACLLIGGTLVAVKIADGARPGMNIVDVLEKQYPYSFTCGPDGDRPRVLVPDEDNPYYFGPPVDSSQLQPEDFIRIATICHRLLDDPAVQRITIITGTDTAEYLGAALARMISHPNKSIVLIAAMKTIEEPGSDALANFHEGRHANGQLDPGIYLFLNRDVHDVRRVHKAHSLDVDAFESIGAQPVATYRHDMQPFIALRLNYLSGNTLLAYHELLNNFDAAWERAHRTKLHDEGTGIALFQFKPDEKDKALDHVRNSFRRLTKEFDTRGRSFTARELRDPAAPVLNTRLDNAAYYEVITPGYRPEWLRTLLAQDDIHGVVLDGIKNLDGSNRTGILQIIAEYADSKPIVTMEDPGQQDERPEREFHESAEGHGAIRSGGVTVAFGTITLKWLLGQNLPLTDIKTAWKFAEYTGGPGYLPKTGRPAEQPSSQSKLSLKNNIRYVHLIPGYEPGWLEEILCDPTVDAVVVGAYGAGNIPVQGNRELLSVLIAHAHRKPIVIRTQCESGPTDLNAYAPGVMALKAGIEAANEMSLNETLMSLDERISAAHAVAVTTPR